MQTIDSGNFVDSEQGAVTSERRHPESEISILDLLIVIGRRKSFLLKSTLAVAILAVIACFVIPNRYEASTTVLPPQQNSSLSSALASQLSGMGTLGALAGGLGLSGGLGLKNPNDLAVSLLKSRTVEEAMIKRFDLQKLYREQRMSDARKAFEKHCVIDSSLKDGLIRLSIRDRDPQRAAQMTNAYIEEYKKFSATLAVTEASQRRLFFEQQLVEAKERLAVAEEEMKKSEQTSGMIQLDSQARALIEAVATLRGQIAAKEVQIRGMSSFAAEENPELKVAKEQLAELQRQLKQLGGSETGGETDLIVPRGKLPQAGLDYLRKLRDVKYYEVIFELLARQFEVAKLDEAREGAIIQVVDPAAPPDRQYFPKISIVVPIAVAVWLFLATAWVLFRRGISKAQNRAEDRERLQTLKDVWSRSLLKP